MKQRHQIEGKLMLRVEGAWWNAYFGKSGDDPGKVHLGSIRGAIVTKSPKTKTLFIEMMSEAVSEAVAEIYGEYPHMEVSSAPEHERSGSA